MIETALVIYLYTLKAVLKMQCYEDFYFSTLALFFGHKKELSP